jgi:hypothetical protein
MATVVAMVSVLVELPPLSDGGSNVAVMPGGTPVMDSATLGGDLPGRATVIVVVAL